MSSFTLNPYALGANRNFSSHIWPGALKTPYEKDLKAYIQTERYDKSSGYEHNKRCFKEHISNSFGAKILECGTYQDLMWLGTTGSTSSYTDALHTSLNEFERFLKEKIATLVKTEFDQEETNATGEITPEDQKIVVDKILELLRVVFTGEFNPNALIDPHYSEDPSYDGPWTTKVPEGLVFRTIFEPGEAHYPESIRLLDLNPDPESLAKDNRPSIFLIRSYLF